MSKAAEVANESSPTHDEAKVVSFASDLNDQIDIFVETVVETRTH